MKMIVRCLWGFSFFGSLGGLAAIVATVMFAKGSPQGIAAGLAVAVTLAFVPFTLARSFAELVGGLPKR